MPKGKVCLTCETWKPLKKFSPMKVGRYGRHSYCKKCRAKQNGPKFLAYRKRKIAALRKLAELRRSA